MFEYLQTALLGAILGGVVVWFIMQGKLDKEAKAYDEDLFKCQVERECLEAEYMRMRDLMEWATNNEL